MDPSIHAKKTAFKEKFVAIWEQIFDGKDPSVDDPNFWNDTLLLRVNVRFLGESVKSREATDLVKLSKIFRKVFNELLSTLGTEEKIIRQVHATEMMAALFYFISQKKWPNFTLDLLQVTVGFDHADSFFRDLFTRAKRVLLQPTSSTHSEFLNLKSNVVSIFMALACACENINQNALCEYFLQDESLFDSLISVITAHGETEVAHKTCVLLATLCSYQKYESKNSYLQKLSLIQAPDVLKAFARSFQARFDQWISDFLSGKISIDTSSTPQQQQPSTPTGSGASSSGTAESGSGSGLLTDWVYGLITATAAPLTSLLGWSTSGSTPPPSPATHAAPSLEAFDTSCVAMISAEMMLLYELVNNNRDFCGCMCRSLAFDAFPMTEENRSSFRAGAQRPRGCPALISSFFALSSLLFQAPKSGALIHYCKLVFLVWLRLVQNVDVCALFFDANVDFGHVFVYRKDASQRWQRRVFEGKGMLAEPLYECIILFMTHNMRKYLHAELYSKALCVVHVLQSHAREYRHKVDCAWVTLWRALIKLCHRVASESVDANQPRQCVLLLQVLTVFNYCITYGNAILPTAEAYDDMLYEIVREQSVFKKVADWVKRQEKAPPSPQAPSPVTLARALSNIEKLIAHFTIKIGAASHLGTLDQSTPEQIKDLIAHSYDNLELTVFGADLFADADEFAENPKEVTYFLNLLRIFVSEARKDGKGIMM